MPPVQDMTLDAEPDLFAGALQVMEAPEMSGHDADEKPDEKAGHAFKTISEAADLLSLPQHVLRFWESKFAQLKPLKLKGGRRYYRPQDIETLHIIKRLLYKEGYTIRGARKAIAAQPRHSADTQPAAAPKPKPRKHREIEDTPLFKATRPAPRLESPPDPAAERKRKELLDIHRELLQLRDMVRALPPMPVDA